MFQNYLKIAWRNLKNNKAFSFINIFGLSVGLTCCILISLYVYHELSYDTHHVNGDRLYRMGTIFIDQGVEDKGRTTSAPAGSMMQAEFPEIEATTRALQLFRDDKTLFRIDKGNGRLLSYYEVNGWLADSNFFQVIPYNFKEGNPRTALQAPNSVVISEDMAEKLFGRAPALDKMVQISSNTNGDSLFRITGVFERPAAPTHVDANFFITIRGGNMDGFANDSPSLANNNMFFTYMLLKEKADAKALEAKFPAFVQRHLSEVLKQTGKGRNYFLMPISEIHLSGIDGGKGEGGSKTTLFILSSIAVLTLLIACINFMNLSTAHSAKRAKEVGIRKVLGAQKSSLLRQFLGESMVMAVIALVFALVLTIVLLPLFETVSGTTLIISAGQKLLLGAFLVALTVVTGLLAGSYPAVFLSSFKPIKVLKGKFTNSLSAVSLRKSLVVFQFVISIVLIIASVVIANQMQYMRLKDLGFAKDQQIILPLRTATAKDNAMNFRNEAASHTGIQSIGAGMAYPGIFHPQDWLMYAQGQNMSSSKRIYINMVDDAFLQTLGVKLLAGRLFSKEFPTDTLTRFVVNEETVKRFGFASPQEAVGKWLAFDWDGQQRQFTIIGVVKDFHFKDLHEPIEPIAFRMYNDASFNYFVAKASGANLKQALSGLETSWKKLNPAEPFEYSFLDQDFQKNYEKESRQAALINYFTIVAIIISCLGLFGLATFTAEQRTKEIGIRKVLGASVYGVVSLLSKDFLKLVMIAVIIASPLAWWGMNKWLQNFAYQTGIDWTVFAITFFIAMLIAFATISFQAIRAALANPVKSLRSE
ncbi:MAG TPA: ABC transporter permease [Flavisolibacter sp.]|jgi:putative ABC transport system permease protein|nr:ABC transporter permease [Flavisolibacter sp.]